MAEARRRLSRWRLVRRLGRPQGGSAAWRGGESAAIVTRPPAKDGPAAEVAGWAQPTGLGTLSFRDAFIRGNSQQRDCEYPCKMTHTISASSTRHPVAPLGYSAPWPAANVEAKVVKCCCLENDLALLSLRAVQLRLVAVADGCGDGVGLQRKCGSVVLCVRSSAITLALHGGLPCLGSGESERRMTDRESASLSRKARSVGGSISTFAKSTLIRSKSTFSRRERSKNVPISS